MCDFVSHINYKGTSYFLTDKDLRGRKFNEYKKYNSRWAEDISGHGAIRFFYPKLQGVGVDKECTDFGSTSNFPKKIAEAIKNMEMTKFGVSVDLLMARAREEYKKTQKPAWEEYNRIENQSSEEYKKIKKLAWEEYKKIQKPAWEEYKKIENKSSEEYKKIKKLAWEEYEKIGKQAQEEYDKIEKQAQEEYNKIEKQALEAYREIIFEAFWDLFRDSKNRTKAWR